MMLRACEFSLQNGIPATGSLCAISPPADLACSHLIRILLPSSHMQPSRAELLASPTEGLLARVQAFTSDVASTAR